MLLPSLLLNCLTQHTETMDSVATSQQQPVLLSQTSVQSQVSAGQQNPVSPPIENTGCNSPNSASSKALQSKLLKQINSLSNKEELLRYVDHCHHLLDTINLATVLYRLARVYSFIQAPQQKATWKTELLESESFTILLSVIHNHLTQSRALLCSQPEVPGLNARCMSNLLWSLVKLEVTSTEGGDVASGMALDVVMMSAPLVLHFLPDCTGQGLGNLLWSFAKIPTSPPSVLTATLSRMVELLQGPMAATALDAQALSNSLWSIAYVRSQPNELEESQEWQDTVTSFLLLAAHHCINMLTGNIGAQSAGPQLYQPATLLGPANEGKFSYQAMVNIAWSFSAILGSACGSQDPIRTLFVVIRQHALTRLHAALSSTPAGRMQAHALTGSFNEQALSHIVHAFREAQLLSPELLQAVFDVAGLRLSRASTGPQGPLGFKPEELGVLLRATHLGIAQPWSFLQSLSQLLTQHPNATATWQPTEILDLQTALQLQLSNIPQQQQQQQQQQRMAKLQAQAKHNQYISPRVHVPAQLMSNSGSGSGAGSPRGTAASNMGTLSRFVSAPQPTLSSLLLELESAAGSDRYEYNAYDSLISAGSNGHLLNSNSHLLNSNSHLLNSNGHSQLLNSNGHQQMNGASLQQSPSLQQAWVMDASGQLKPITLVMNPQLAALGGQATWSPLNSF